MPPRGDCTIASWRSCMIQIRTQQLVFSTDPAIKHRVRIEWLIRCVTGECTLSGHKLLPTCIHLASVESRLAYVWLQYLLWNLWQRSKVAEIRKEIYVCLMAGGHLQYRSSWYRNSADGIFPALTQQWQHASSFRPVWRFPSLEYPARLCGLNIIPCSMRKYTANYICLKYLGVSKAKWGHAPKRQLLSDRSWGRQSCSIAQPAFRGKSVHLSVDSAPSNVWR